VTVETLITWTLSTPWGAFSISYLDLLAGWLLTLIVLNFRTKAVLDMTRAKALHAEGWKPSPGDTDAH